MTNASVSIETLSQSTDVDGKSHTEKIPAKNSVTQQYGSALVTFKTRDKFEYSQSELNMIEIIGDLEVDNV